jgi:hypothetical protein
MVHTTSITDIIDVLLLLLTVLIYYLLRISHSTRRWPPPLWSVIRFVRLPIDPLQTSFVRGYFSSLFLALLFLFQTPLLTPHPRPDTTRQRPRGTTARASTANISPFSSVLPHNRKSPLRPCLPCRSLNSASPPPDVLSACSSHLLWTAPTYSHSLPPRLLLRDAPARSSESCVPRSIFTIPCCRLPSCAR